jgi:hypothetical protein
MKIQKKFGWVWGGLTAGLCVLAPAAAAENELDFSLDPSWVRMAGKPGETLEFSVNAINNGSKALKIGVEVNDMLNQLSPDGELQRVYVPPATAERSIAKWLTVNESEFVLEPKQTRAVPFVMTVPPEGDGVYYSILFFRGLGVAEQKGESEVPKTTIMIQPRLGTLIFCESKDTVRRVGKLLDLKFDPPTDEEPLKIHYEIENTGNADILLTGHFYVLDSGNALVAKEILSPVRTFPGDKGRALTEWEGILDPGAYHAVVQIELGPEATEVIVREFDFEIKEEAAAAA